MAARGAIDRDRGKVDSALAVEARAAGAEVGDVAGHRDLGREAHAVIGRLAESQEVLGRGLPDRVPQHVDLAGRAQRGTRRLHLAVVRGARELAGRGPRRASVGRALEIDLVAGDREERVRQINGAAPARGVGGDPRLVEQGRLVRHLARELHVLPGEHAAGEASARDREGVVRRVGIGERRVVEHARSLVHRQHRITGPPEGREAGGLGRISPVGPGLAAVGRPRESLVGAAGERSLAVVPRRHHLIAGCGEGLFGLGGVRGVSRGVVDLHVRGDPRDARRGRARRPRLGAQRRKIGAGRRTGGARCAAPGRRPCRAAHAMPSPDPRPRGLGQLLLRRQPQQLGFEALGAQHMLVDLVERRPRGGHGGARGQERTEEERKASARNAHRGKTTP